MEFLDLVPEVRAEPDCGNRRPVTKDRVSLIEEDVWKETEGIKDK